MMKLFEITTDIEKARGKHCISLSEDGVFTYEGPDGIKRSVAVLTPGEAQIFSKALRPAMDAMVNSFQMRELIGSDDG